MLFYSFAGLVVASEISLPGLARIEEAAEEHARISVGDMPESLSGAIKAGPNWAVSETQLVIEIPRLASFLLTDGRSIQVQPAARRRAEETAPFLSQNILGLLLQQRGRFALRASAVEIDGRAVLFCGDSGSGKSTFAAAMAGRGKDFLADDLCVVDSAAGGVLIVHGDGARPRIWADAIDALGIRAEVTDAARAGIQKYEVRLSSSLKPGLPLAGIYVLAEDRRVEMPDIETFAGMKAVQLLRECAFRPSLVEPFGLKASYLQSAAAIARAARVFRLRRGRGFDWIGGTLEAIETSLAFDGRRGGA